MSNVNISASDVKIRAACLTSRDFDQQHAHCRCLIFESTAQGDLHEYLLTHSPKSDLAMTVPRTGESERVLDFGDMSYMAIQVAGGMEYLAQHHFIHR